MTPKISVIIPVYNAPADISKCIDSLMSQTLEGIEIIFVDDHSTDDSIDRIKAASEGRRADITIKHLQTPKNCGPGGARNAGIDNAAGEYLAFVDIDDWVDADCYEKLYNAAKRANADICYGHVTIEENGRQSIARNPIVEDGAFGDGSKEKFLLNYVTYFYSLIYSKSFVDKNSIRFPELKSSEDSFFEALSLFRSQRISHINDAFYHYLIHGDSISHQRDDNRYKQKFEAFARLIAASADEHRELAEYLLIKKAYIVSSIEYLRNNPDADKTTLKKYTDELLRALPNYKSNKYLKKDLKTKAVVSLLTGMPKTACLVLPKILK